MAFERHFVSGHLRVCRQIKRSSFRRQPVAFRAIKSLKSRAPEETACPFHDMPPSQAIMLPRPYLIYVCLLVGMRRELPPVHNQPY